MWKEFAVVISKGEEALDMARALGLRTLTENPPFGLNRSLRTVSKVLADENAESITVIPADLVLLTVDELDTIYNLRMELPGVIIVPDRFKAGTNILSINPLGAIPFKYGRNSFLKHCQAVKSADVPLRIIESPYLGFDLDTEKDLLELDRLCPEIRNSIPEICCFEKVFP
jgi:2-phospho-L-lactate guanylyltransferase